MGPRDHRIHLGRKDSPKSSPQIHSSTKSCFSGVIFYSKNAPKPKCRPQISPEADFLNFSNSLQKERTANPSEILSRIHPSKLQTEPRGEKHISVFFYKKISSFVSETQHLPPKGFLAKILTRGPQTRSQAPQSDPGIRFWIPRSTFWPGDLFGSIFGSRKTCFSRK